MVQSAPMNRVRVGTEIACIAQDGYTKGCACAQVAFDISDSNYSETVEHVYDVMPIIQQLNGPNIEFTADLTFRYPLPIRRNMQRARSFIKEMFALLVS